MGRDELASLVSEWITRHDERGRLSAFDANHLGKLERGSVTRPSAPVRAALCAILDATERDLGLAPAAAPQARSVALSADRTTLDGISGVLTSVRKLEGSVSPADLMPTVLAQRSLVMRLADESRGSARRRSVDLLSNIETYLGWLALSLEQWAESQRYLDRACALALEADAPARLSTALSFLAYRSQRRGNLTAAESQCEAAARDERLHIGIRAYVNYQRAEILALDGQRQESRSILKVADTLSAQLPNDNRNAWNHHGYHAAHRAFVLDSLGEKRTARAIAYEALDTLPERSNFLRINQARHRLTALIS